jgi:hypothetical protein
MKGEMADTQSNTTQPVHLERLVNGVRRREVLQLLATQFMLALTIGAGGLVLLLLLGTQVLDWYWPLLLALISFAVLLFRVRNRLPSAYGAAQRIDKRLGTSDLLSSAWHFRQHPSKSGAPALVQAAESTAVAIPLDQAAPWASPSGWGRAAAVSAIALSLLVVRYAFQSSLNLEQPIAPGLYNLMASAEKPRELGKKKAKGEEALPLEGIQTESAQKSAEEKFLEKAQELSTQSDSSSSTQSSAQKPGQFQQSMVPNEDGENIEGGEKADGNTRQESSDGDNSEGKKDAKDFAKKQQPDPKNNRGDQQGDNNSLIDKFKDAMANLMNKMKNQDKNQGQSQQTKDNQQGQEGAGQQKQNAQAQQNQGKKQSDAQQAGDAQQGQQMGEGNDKSPNQQAKGGDKGGEPPQSDAKSGSGKQDGDKTIELAQQQQAMGKLSELFGKRAQDIQGEIMIEVSSSKSQALKTGYSSKSGAHSDKGGVILRDEVPLEFQGYVQKYFEEIRKPAPPAQK